MKELPCLTFATSALTHFVARQDNIGRLGDKRSGLRAKLRTGGAETTEKLREQGFLQSTKALEEYQALTKDEDKLQFLKTKPLGLYAFELFAFEDPLVCVCVCVKHGPIVLSAARHRSIG